MEDVENWGGRVFEASCRGEGGRIYCNLLLSENPYVVNQLLTLGRTAEDAWPFGGTLNSVVKFVPFYTTQ